MDILLYTCGVIILTSENNIEIKKFISEKIEVKNKSTKFFICVSIVWNTLMSYFGGVNLALLYLLYNFILDK